MDTFFDKIRELDFNTFWHAYDFGRNFPIAENAYKFFAFYGIVFFFVSYIYLILRKKIRAFFCTFLAMGIAGFFDLAILIFWRRPQPFVSHPEILDSLRSVVNLDGGSFPSSHTYVVFAIATSVFLYGHKKLGTVLLLLSIVVALSRVGVGFHYPSDVIGGGIIGIIAGVMAFRIIQKAQKNWD